MRTAGWLTVNDGQSLLNAAISGLGIAYLPNYLYAEALEQEPLAVGDLRVVDAVLRRERVARERFLPEILALEDLPEFEVAAAEPRIELQRLPILRLGLLHLADRHEPARDREPVGAVPLHSQRQRLHAAQGQEAVEGTLDAADGVEQEP